MPYYVQMSSGELYHHGILGQKWGQRNGPPYPLGSGDHSAREEKAGWKKSLSRNAKEHSHYSVKTSKKKNFKNQVPDVKDISKYLNVDAKKAEQLKKAAMILGITAGTAAGMVALGYLASNTGALDKLLAAPNSYFQALESGYNNSGSFLRYKLDGINNARKNGDFVGRLASAKGYDLIDSNYLSDAISDPLANSHKDLDSLIEEMRMNIRDGDGARRLSCWSGSHAYYMSALTGHDFASKSYENLVDFNDFGNLYNTKQKIFDLKGNLVSNFVGKFGNGFGQKFRRADEEDAAKLLRSIANNITKDINLTPDGSRSIGFIDAAYGGTTCTHQWNFEVEYLANNVKRIFMADSYVGDRYPVAEMTKNSVSYLKGFDKLTNELHHYNADSIRFYAPALSDINTNSVSQVILGKTKEPDLSYFNASRVTSQQIDSAFNSLMDKLSTIDFSSVKNMTKDEIMSKVDSWANLVDTKFSNLGKG